MTAALDRRRGRGRRNRGRFAALLGVGLLAAGACSRSLEPAPAPDRPHVLLISLDTLRADRLGSYGHTRDTSPFLDSLAAGGTRFATPSSTP
ncbi:MAG: sulfatase-like hydrolase/transferase, partial [Acidobacteriota bacterium]